ncbi:MAG: hypothetical protein QOI34_457 [Verrucomicrobiota bacterium]|jgi:hypothetical protein
MKIFNYRSRKAMTVIMCVLFLSRYAASQAMSADARSSRVAVESSAFTQSVKDPARLIVRRIPNLGNNVVVNLCVDGVPFAAVAYGHTYDGSLPLGRHVLSVKPTPNPKWPAHWQMALDVRSGETYSFTAMDDNSGELILKGG